MNAYQANTNLTNVGPLSYIMGTGILPQILLTLAICTTLYIVLMSLEIVYKSVRGVKGTFVNLMPFTVSAEDKPRVFEQNPNNKDAKLLPMSDNERSGAEFSYSFYLWINPSSFKQEDALLHIMHKGNPNPYPLMGPGVFLRSNVNTLRIYMNNSKTWNNYVDIENLPVKKWFHVVLLARDNSLEVYINGNLTKKLNANGAILYQNFGNLYLFNQRPCMLNPVSIPSLEGVPFRIMGAYSGNMSNLYYYSYALSYTEIQALLNEGPSRKTEASTPDTPPYFQDSWWVSNYSR